MTGKNESTVEGFLRYPELKQTATGKSKFSGKIAVPFTYTDRASNEQKEASNYISISAWGETAEGLAVLTDGTPVRIRGAISQRSYDGNCKDCGTAQKKYWSEVVVSNYVIVED